MTGKISNFYIRQTEDRIRWYGEDDPLFPTWSQIAYGKVVGKIITLEWIDIPKGTSQLRGNLVLEIKFPDRLELIHETSGFGSGSEWTRTETNPED